MHVILGLLGSVITILVLLNRLAEAGIDLGGLNPFLWRRRRQWQKQYKGNPIYKIESPLDAAALLAVGTAKCDGDMSAEEKTALLNLFQSEFGLGKKDSAELLIASAYLLGKGEELRTDLEKVMSASLPNFSQDQANSTLELLESICALETSGAELKREFVARVKNLLDENFRPKGKWD